MASVKLLAVLAMLVILLQASAQARHNGKPNPCSGEDSSMPGPDKLDKHRKPGHCPGTHGIMTLHDFDRGEQESEPAECDGKYHRNRDMIVSLSTRWYAGGRRCHKPIRIMSKHNGRTVEAIVVDECDAKLGCKDNIVDTSFAVWKALGLEGNLNEAPITWSDA